MEEHFECIVEEYLASAPRGHRGHRDPFGAPGGIEEAEGDAALTLICGPHGSGKTRYLAQRAEDLIARGLPPKRTLYLDLADGRLPHHLDRSALADALEAYFARVPASRREPFCLFLDRIQSVAGWEGFARALVDAYPARIWAADAWGPWLSQPLPPELPANTKVRGLRGPSAASVLRRLAARAAEQKEEDPLRQALAQFYRLGRTADAHGPAPAGARARRDVAEGCAEDVMRLLPSTPLPLVQRTAALLLGAAGGAPSLAGVQRTLAREGLSTTRTTVAAIAEALERAQLICRLSTADVPADGNPRAPHLIFATDHGIAQAFSPLPLAGERLLAGVVFSQLYEEGAERTLTARRLPASRSLLLTWETPGSSPAALILHAAGSGRRPPARLLADAEALLAETGTRRLEVVTDGAGWTYAVAGGAVEAAPLGEWVLDRAGMLS
ncbi:AAA family ATPase [Adlercreutzia caecimuris]|uniref:AAA family ATPase n=1 Tax=Adlercreutzia caecimuris TaxID=671266 RepID=UPI002585E68D|nr:AAA family ATPase [Adlercreutzia caecimuris]